jgi:hypothetical protein
MPYIILLIRALSLAFTSRDRTSLKRRILLHQIKTSITLGRSDQIFQRTSLQAVNR